MDELCGNWLEKEVPAPVVEVPAPVVVEEVPVPVMVPAWRPKAGDRASAHDWDGCW